MLAKVSRLFHTLWPLKLVQHWGLFYYRVLRRVMPFKPTTTKVPRAETLDAKFHVYQPVGWKGGMEFDFLNSAATVDVITWQAPEQSLLWHYNLHYFDHLNAKDNYHAAKDESALILAWWQVHQPLQGVAWDPYPASLRAVNLCKWGWAHNCEFQYIPHDEWVAILDRHYQEVKRKLEYHIQANHLFANIKALWFLQAALPEYKAKDSVWLNRIVKRELDVQFDSDGGHFELSPMYHRIMLWDLLDMYALGLSVTSFKATTKVIAKLLPKAVVWMKALSHPDSQVAFFNDAAMGIAPEIKLVLAYAKALNVKETAFVNGVYSGYTVVALGENYLICDTAEAGPAIQPGHVHADSLSFELSIGQQRVFVNSGTSEYGASSERLRQRSTAAHNTVVYAGQNSSDVWSGFRCGKQASVVKRETNFESDAVVVLAKHDGYQPVFHQREWVLKDSSLQINDKLAAEGGKQSFLYLHPEIKAEQQSSSNIILRWADRSMSVVVSNGDVNVIESTWHPEFGAVQQNVCLVITWHGAECAVKMKW